MILSYNFRRVKLSGGKLLIIEKVNTPDDVRKLPIGELKQLAKELRKYIVDVVSETGGHLASSLGVVDITVALLKVFSPPEDEIVWDVGHQAYSYKILTDRKREFLTLRQYKGISGFPSIKESHYDAFGAGHSSISISAALGIKVAKRLKGEKGKVIAVIGDGALTAGEAYEGLNNAGQLGEDIVVILNDNRMSISPNIGAMANYLIKVTTDEWLRRTKSRFENVSKKIFGESLYRRFKRFEDLMVKGLFPPGMLFEDLGFRYIGPVDGHNLDTLVSVFNNVSKMKGPTLIHVITKKGKGYEPAEVNPEKFHGVAKKNKTPSVEKTLSKWTSVFSDTIIKLAENDNRIVAITAAMPSGTGLDKFYKKFPDRYFDVGIAEQHAVTFAAGLAKKGLKPVVAIYSTFLQRAYDQIIHDVALQSLPVIFAIDRSGIVGEDGATHHGMFDLSYMRIVPNMVVTAPKDENELRDLFYTGIVSDVPFAIRYPRGVAPGVVIKNKFDKIRIGTWEVLKDGKDILIVASGWEVSQSIEAAKRLKRKGMEVTVVNARFIKPIDDVLLGELAKKHKVVITIEENTVKGGLGSAVNEFLSNWYDGKVFNIGVPDMFVEHGEQMFLRKNLGLTGEELAERILNICGNLKSNSLQ